MSTETLEQLRQRMATKPKRAPYNARPKKERRSYYFYLPHNEQEICDAMDGKLLTQCFDEGYAETALEALGCKINRYRIHPDHPVSVHHKEAIALIKSWFAKARALDELNRELNS